MNLTGILSNSPLQYLSIRPKRGFTSQGGEYVFAPQVTVEEEHTEEAEITEHPVERGAMIADHAVIRPSEVVVTIGWSNSPSASDLLAGALSSNPAVAALVNQFSGPVNQVAGQVLSASPVVQSLVNAAAGLNVASDIVGTLSSSQNTYVDSIYAQLKLAYQTRTLFNVQTARAYYQNMLIRMLSFTTDQQTQNSLIIRVGFRQLLLVNTTTTALQTSSVPTANPILEKPIVTPISLGNVKPPVSL